MSRVALLGGIAVLVLGGIVAAEWRDGTSLPAAAPIALQPASPSPGPIAAAGLPAADRVAILLARPLFNPGRRPEDVAAGGAPAGLTRLSGVLLSPGGRQAIFAAPEGGRPVVVAEGARIAGYVVAAIDRDGVTLIGPDGRRRLQPTLDAAARVAPAATPLRTAARQSSR